MKIGDKVSVRPETFGRGVREGKVIWIHPDKRFAMVEFEVQPHLTWTFTQNEDGTLRLVEEDTEQRTKTEYLCRYVDEIPEESSMLFMF